ncbi:MAG: nicotinate-nucleotide adenylyltransferase [Eggerthellaceae bacterium]|nr:nicotinate-nucleotide adenylyltransferase [Eggerthellaceae bacterium]
MSIICERFDSLGLGDPSATVRLGIMGGTFDPIHIGHLACAEQARVAHGLDAVVFIPTGVQPFKRDKKVTDAAMRFEMCRLACASNPHFDVSSIEIDREGETYTVDTLRQLRAHYPDNVHFYFITGADAMLSIVKWRDSALIADLAHLIAVTRPGYVMTDEAKEELAAHADFDVSYLETTALSVSSSMLREWVGCGKSIRYLTSLAVHDYILARGLYA